MFIPTILICNRTLFCQAPLHDYLILLASGALAIGLADTMFFKSLNLLGAGLSAIVDCLYSPFIIILSILFLGERLNLFQVIGACMIVSAVLTATSIKGRGTLDKKDLFRGVVWGALAMASMAVGVVMIKPVLNRSSLLWVTEVRLIGGSLTLLLLLLFNKNRTGIIQSLFSAKSWHYTVFGSLIGSYVAMVFWLAGIKYTQASIAAALNQTSNIFIFIFAGIFLKETINRYRLAAIAIAVAGAILVTFF